ncbi:TPA: GlsB/YeaQ/YmgE family stress response membrane protein [Candidatus Berkelbacteria bacterium]|nr:GlsB/YeaQ/YmgE family stress response membrane protein [Candidatus Berkelbacteria bacterium]
MSWIITIIVGGLIGWIANGIYKTGHMHGLLVDIVVGIVGSLLGKYVFYDLLGIGSAASSGSFSFFGIFWGVIGAIILISILRLLKIC